MFLSSTVSTDEVFLPLDVFLLLGVGLLLLSKLGLACDTGSGITTAIEQKLTKRNLPGAVCHLIQKMPIMRHQDDGARESNKGFLQPI